MSSETPKNGSNNEGGGGNYGAIETAESSKSSTPKTTDAPRAAVAGGGGGAKPSHSLWGITFIMLGAFSFSVMFLLVKVMEDANTFTLVFYRSLVQIAISWGTLLVQGENPLGPNEWEPRLYLIARAVFGAMAVCMWFFGIQVLPLPDAVTLQFTTPPFAAAFAVCMVGETWLPLDILGAVVCLTGVAFIAHPTWLFGTHDDVAATTTTPPTETVDEEQNAAAAVLLKALAVLVTTGGAACAGIAYVCVRKIGDRASAQVMVLYYGVLSIPLTILGSGYFLGTYNVWTIPGATALDWFWLLLMGFGGYGGQWFTNLGLQQETAATATLATSTQIVWTYIFELAFLHESINGWSLAGTGLILGYMLMVAFLKLLAANTTATKTTNNKEEEEALLDVGDEENAETTSFLALQRNNSSIGTDSEKRKYIHQKSF